MRVFLVVLSLLFASIAQAQLQHVVIYCPGKMQAVESVGPTASTVETYKPDLGCKLQNVWPLKQLKSVDTWYGIVDVAEYKCLLELKDTKLWFGKSAKEAWFAAYESGLPDAVLMFEKNIKYPIDRCDEVGKPIIDEKTGLPQQIMVSVEEAKKLEVKIEPKVFEDAGDEILPMKVLQLWGN